MLHWAITFFLIGLVSLVFSFGGTAGEAASLLGRVAAISCLLMALVMVVVYIRHRHRHPGAG